MESLIVHPKNQMELNALKSVMKEMGIKFEKFHTRNMKNLPEKPVKNSIPKKEKTPNSSRNYPKKD